MNRALATRLKGFQSRNAGRVFQWLAAALMTAAMQFSSTADVLQPELQISPDGRIARLEAFFKLYHCPKPYHTDEYLIAADANALDYRLLPALSVRESTCGLHARLNNRWGWDSAKTGFESVVHGIHYVSQQLGSGKYYRGKTLEEKLRMYNPNPAYAEEVKTLMRQIASD